MNHLLTVFLLISSAFSLETKRFQFPCNYSLKSSGAEIVFRNLKIDELIKESGLKKPMVRILKNSFSLMTYYDFILNSKDLNLDSYVSFGITELIYPIKMVLDLETAHSEYAQGTGDAILAAEKISKDTKKFVFFVPPNMLSYRGNTFSEFFILIEKLTELRQRGIFVFGAYNFLRKKTDEGFSFKKSNSMDEMSFPHESALEFISRYSQ